MSHVITPPHPMMAPSDSDEAPTDARLLERFIQRRDQSAFEALVRAHGPMVYGVCLRMLGNPHDAEDAFQATFLILAQKAASIVRRGMPANWLFQVAHRSALKVRSAASRRRQREKQMIELPEAAKEPSCDWSELAPALDDAVQSLPHKYQVAVVLCDLEGKTRRDAARQLGWPEGTLVTRLTKAREILANRLTRQGIVLSTGSLVLLLSQHAASAAVPGVLVAATAQAAAAAIPLEVTSATMFSAKGTAVAKGLVETALLTKGVAAAALAGVVAVAGLAVHATQTETPKEPEPAGRAAEVQVLPQNIQLALEENARQLSPISVSYSMEFKSELPVEETIQRLKMPANERWLFTRTTCRTAWQGHNFYMSMNPPRGDGNANNHPLDLEVTYVGDVRSQFIRHVREGSARLFRTRVDKSIPLGFETSMFYLANAAFLALQWDPAEKAQLQFESEILKALKNKGKLLSVEEVLVEERPHLRITVETENFVKVQADAAALQIEANERRAPPPPEMQEQQKQFRAKIEEQRNTPATRRIVFDLDPALHYAVRRAEHWYDPDTLLKRTICSDFEQVAGRTLWLPRRCETEMHEFPTMSTVFNDVLMTQVLEVTDLDSGPVPQERFVLNATTPGTVVLESSLVEGTDSPARTVTYTVPQRAEDLEGVIAKARQEAANLPLAPGTSAAPPSGAGAIAREGQPVLESGSVETSDRPPMIWILAALNGVLLAGAVGYVLYKKRRSG